MISDKMTDAINTQVNAEIFSAYLYYAMSAWALDAGYTGSAKWLACQGAEELTHAQRFIHYLNQVGSRVVFAAIEAPPKDYSSLKSVFEKVLEHEQKVTKLIHELTALAKTEKDYATEIFLQWFVSEQVEEEESVNDILSKLGLVGNAAGGLFFVDRELGMRANG